MKLLTIADGFGDSQAVPPWYPGFLKWPEIINLMTKGVELLNLSRYGAGNEYIMQCLRNNLNGQDQILVQWANPDRLDLVLDTNREFWDEQIQSDAVYNSNLKEVNGVQYWISSDSKNPYVLEYHKKFITSKQHQLRSQMFVEHATLLLNNHDLKYNFLLTPDSGYLKDLNTNNWCWHSPFKGMDSFRKVSKFSTIDFGLLQPISLIMFDFVNQFIMPVIDLPWRRQVEINGVENLLYRKYKEALINKPSV